MKYYFLKYSTHVTEKRFEVLDFYPTDIVPEDYFSNTNGAFPSREKWEKHILQYMVGNKEFTCMSSEELPDGSKVGLSLIYKGHINEYMNNKTLDDDIRAVLKRYFRDYRLDIVIEGNQKLPHKG